MQQFEDRYRLISFDAELPALWLDAFGANALCKARSTSVALGALQVYAKLNWKGTPVVNSGAKRRFTSCSSVLPILTIFGIAGLGGI